MKYQYNYDFLPKWKKLNPQISPNAIQSAIGSKSNNAFKSWLRKDGPMPIITILRFCNAFQIPLTSFFVDADAEGDMLPARPMPDDQLEPNCGYSSLEGRQQGERSILNPLDVTVMPSHIPGGQHEEQKQKEHCEEKEIVVGNISDANMAELIKLQREQNEQKSRLLDIIAEQQKQITDLTREIIQMKQRKASQRYDYGMAAEPDPHR